MPKVSLSKNNNSYQGTLAVLKPLENDLKEKLKKLDKIVIKINFVTTKKELATTPFDSVKGFIDFIKPFYKKKIIIAEEASIGNTKSGFASYGFTDLANSDPQVEVFDSGDDEVEEEIIKYENHRLSLPFANIFTNSPFIVSITRAKTHDFVVVTLGIKNILVGAIQGGMPNRVKIHRGYDIHKILAKISKIVYPDFVLIDGVVGMQGNGPDKGFAKNSGWLMAGFDALAVDSLAAYLMGFDIKDIGYLNLIHQLRLGKLYAQDKIEVIGNEPKNLVDPYKHHDTFSSQRLWK
ncbi:DUF362 domain-containing protein [Patescibacteria group bacterium]